jgi:FkbM family methyltransferase
MEACSACTFYDENFIPVPLNPVKTVIVGRKFRSMACSTAIQIRRSLARRLPAFLHQWGRLVLSHQREQKKIRYCQAGLNYLAGAFPKLSLSVLDVGARYGAPIHELPGLPWFPRVRLVGIEPDSSEARKLESKETSPRYEKVYPVAVWNTPGVRELMVTAHPGCSSILSPNEDLLARYADAPWFKVTGQVRVEVTTLDKLFAEDEFFDFVKVDVQGGELEVLRGGERILSRAEGLVFEAHLTPIYRDQETFPRIHDFCMGRDFRLISLVQAHEFDGEVVEINCAYVREPISTGTEEAFLKKLLFALCLYNVDYVEFLLRNFGDLWLKEATLQGLLKVLSLSLKSPRELPA